MTYKTDDHFLGILESQGADRKSLKEIRHRLETRQKTIQSLQKVVDEATRILTDTANQIKKIKRSKSQ